MATVVYEDPIHHLSGKISKKYRTTYNYRKRSNRKYTSVHGNRTTPVTEKETAWRDSFAEICATTRYRMKDPSFMASDQAAFIKQNKYKTFYQYVWNVVRQEMENGK
ncbi:MAG: hypothetical protein IKV22_07175 [Paludibacteraceae bacterium]|nr:hypothetical protein [Paludibacteraceae bacterium]